MKRKVIETIQVLLYAWMTHLMLMALAIGIMGLFGREQSYVLLWAAMYVIPVSLYFARAYIKNFFLFSITHLLWPVIVLMMPFDILRKAVMMLVLIVYMVLSFKERFSEGEDDRVYDPDEEVKEAGEILPPVFVVCIIGVLALIETFFSKRGWEAYYVLMILMYFGCYFLHHFISQYLNFLKVNGSSTAQIPEREIFRSGIKQAFSFTVGGMVILFLSANIGWFSSIMSVIGKGILALLRWLLSGERNYEATDPGFPVQSMSPGNMDMIVEDVQPFFLWVILEKIVFIVVPVVMIALAVYAAVTCFQYLWKRFHTSRNGKARVILSGQDIRETLTIEKENKESIGVFSFLNPREKIRKIYKKRILKRKQEIIGEHNSEELEYMTAKECCEKIADENMKRIYEKARYSEDNITAEDVRIIRNTGK